MSSSPVPRLAFSHMGLYVTDLARMADFYTRVLGLTETDRGRLGSVELSFLSKSPLEHHQIVLVSGRPADAGFNTINQVSFRMAEFAGLREMHGRVQREGMKEIAPVCHGNALSVYFRDPEGNRVELFVDTPWYVQQPLRVPMDLSLSDAELWAWAEAEARRQPGFQRVEDWRHEIGRKMAQ
jgi:catechol-2,3-dioxygenase